MRERSRSAAGGETAGAGTWVPEHIGSDGHPGARGLGLDSLAFWPEEHISHLPLLIGSDGRSASQGTYGND